jgi:diguanylate cyclase (GGDEF)-like protein
VGHKELLALIPERDHEARRLQAAGRIHEANREFDQALAELPTDNDPGRRTLLLLRRAVLAWLLRRVPLALELAAEGWAELDSPLMDARCRAFALGHLGYLLQAVGNRQAQLETARSAVEVARQTGDSELLARSLQVLGGALNRRAVEGQEASRLATFREAAVLLREGIGLQPADEYMQRALLSSYGSSLAGMGELDQAMRTALASLRLSERASDRSSISFANGVLSSVHRQHGELVRARTLASRAVYQANLTNDDSMVLRFAPGLADICGDLGDPVGEAAALRHVVSAQQRAIDALRQSLGHAIEQRKIAIRAQHSAAAADATAARDPLTGLTNRLGLERAAPPLLDQAAAQGEAAWLILADVDRLKGINDQAGHPAGDAILREIANLLRGECRADDVVARWAGDEFVVLLGQPTNDNGTVGAAVAERIRAAVDSHNWSSILGAVNHPTLSVGVAAGNASFEQLFTAADQALYRAKRHGRNRVEVHPRFDVDHSARG